MPSIITPTALIDREPVVPVPTLKESKKSEIPIFPPFAYASTFDEAVYGDFRDEIVQKGYAVIPAIAVEEALALREQAHQWLEDFQMGYKRDDPSTFTVDKLPVHMKGGMYHGYGIAHMDWVWATRTHPGVVSAFAKVWGTDELITSFDGASIMLPGGKSLHDGGRWPHLDQNPFRKGFYCLQGIVNLNENGPDDGGLLVLEGSHRLISEHFAETGRTETRSWGPVDWCGFEPEEEQWFYDRGCEWKKVCAQPGDLILWDSRAMHCNQPPSGRVDRVCTYVTMAPAKLASESDLKLRNEAFEQYRGTTHVPFASIYSRPHEPKTRIDTGLADPLDTGIPRKPVEVTDQVLRLVGALPY